MAVVKEIKAVETRAVIAVVTVGRVGTAVETAVAGVGIAGRGGIKFRDEILFSRS